MQVVDPQRAIIMAGIMIVIGVVVFLVRNKKRIGTRLKNRYE